ncbi:alanine racemase [Pseudactinotalea sp.]|uniref:alanine racemase n=1 Tax=Pseudactinotalea sp. TaxID=1926260 RepID=UPI003B3BC0BB
MRPRYALDWQHKGFPATAHGQEPSELAALGLRVPDDVSTPFAVLRTSALQRNLEAMAAWCRERRVDHAPHVKTTMSPELMRMQLEAGAWGTTAATAWQARVQIELGSRRVMIANECLDEPGLRWLAERVRDDDGLEVLLFVDSRHGIEVLERVAAAVGGTRALGALVDLGVHGGRAGIRDPEQAVQLAEQVAAAKGVQLAGVGGYEGVIAGDRTADGLTAVRTYLQRLRDLALRLAPLVQRPGGGVVTAGGSLFYDLVADELGGLDGMRTVIRPGCYLVHDHGVYARNTDDADHTRPQLRAAMEVWARVLSTPEPGLALADAGRRDISSDAGMPALLAVVRDGRREAPDPGVAVTGFNDQHTFLSLPTDGPTAGLVPQVGDALVLGISHPCTTIDKWRAIALVDDDGTITGAVHTVF